MKTPGERKFRLVEPIPAPPEPKEERLEKPAAAQTEFFERCVQPLYQEAQRSQQMEEAPAAVQEFLRRNPDLAADWRKGKVLYFCLKNYININPEFTELSFLGKLEEAGKIARDLLEKIIK